MSEFVNSGPEQVGTGVETAYGDIGGMLDEHAPAPTQDNLTASTPGGDTGGAPDPAAAAPTPATDPAAAAATQQATTGAAPSEFVINRNGQLIKVPANDPRIQQWASQGYDYAQRMAEFNRQQQALADQAREYEDRFKAVDEFVRTPEGQQWWDHVQSQWQARNQIDPSNPLNQKISSLEKRLEAGSQVLNEIAQERAQQKIAQENQALEAEIKSIRDQYADLDFDALNPETGKSLLFSVGEYAVQKGIKSFKTAFRDFYHDSLVKREADRAKEAAAKEIQAKKKSGLLGTSPTPTKGVTQASGDLKSRNYLDLMEEGLDEYKSALSGTG